MGKIILIVGTTGVGKTSLVRALAQKVNFKLCLEQHIDRPFQALFKYNPQYSLANQIDYLLLRAEQEHALRLSPDVGLVDGGLDLDFHGFTRLFHFRGMLSDAEFDLCKRLYEFCRSQLPMPELIIRLMASPDIIRERLSKRNRINIANIDDASLLDSFLDQWLITIPSEKIISLEVSEFSESFVEIMPSLMNRLTSILRLDAGTYDTGYIP